MPQQTVKYRNAVATSEASPESIQEAYLRGPSLLLTSKADQTSIDGSWNCSVDTLPSKPLPLCCAFLPSGNSLLELCGNLLFCFWLLCLQMRRTP